MKCLLRNKHQNKSTYKELTYVLRYTFRELSTLNFELTKRNCGSGSVELWKLSRQTLTQLKVIFAKPLVSNE